MSTRIGKQGHLFIPPFPFICTFVLFLNKVQERCKASPCQVVTLTPYTLGKCLEVAWEFAYEGTLAHAHRFTMVLSIPIPGIEPVLGSRPWSQQALLDFPWAGQNRPAKSRATRVSLHGFEDGKSRQLCQGGAAWGFLLSFRFSVDIDIVSLSPDRPVLRIRHVTKCCS